MNNTFGRYIDHDPSEHKLDAPFKNTQRLYKAEFGDYIYQDSPYRIKLYQNDAKKIMDDSMKFDLCQ